MLKFSLGVGDKTKFMFNILGLTSGFVWYLLPTIMVGSIMARKYESFKQVPVKDYYFQLNFLCFHILDIFVIRKQEDPEKEMQMAKLKEDESINVQLQKLNRSTRRKLGVKKKH